MNQFLVVAALEVHVGQAHDRLVEEGLDAVGRPDRRHGADLTMGEHLPDLLLGRQVQVAIQFLAQPLHIHPVAGRNHDHGVAGLVLDHDRLGDMVLGHVGRFRGLVAGTAVRVCQQLVINRCL